MTTRTKRQTANSTRLAAFFLKRLDKGEILDRTQRVDRNHRPVIQAPKVLKRVV